MRWSGWFSYAMLILASGTPQAKEPVYRPPRLENGRPDFQGMWDHTDATPLVRPPGFTALIISPAEATRIEALLTAVTEDRATPTEPTEFFNERHIMPIRGELRSSIVIDPDDGLIPWTPPFADWVSKTRFNVLHATDGPEQRPTSERCLGNPASQPPNLYNPGTNLRQIVQTADAVVLTAEFDHQTRIIRMNSRHAQGAVTSWTGDSIGWWEGDTLVVETKHFSPGDSGRVSTPVTFMVSPQATVTERITRVSDGELNYVFTVEDPKYYTRSWKGETHFFRTDDRILEYACHEGNSSLTSILQAARIRDGQMSREP